MSCKITHIGDILARLSLLISFAAFNLSLLVMLILYDTSVFKVLVQSILSQSVLTCQCLIGKRGMFLLDLLL